MAKKKRAETQSKKFMAEQLYMSNQLSNEDIANAVGVSRNTISAWVVKHAWKERKGAVNASRNTIVRNTLIRIAALTEDWKDQEGEPKSDASKADEILKLTKVVEAYSPNRASVSSQIETMRQFMAFLLEEDPALAKKVTDYSQEFIQICVNNATGQ